MNNSDKSLIDPSGQGISLKMNTDMGTTKMNMVGEKFTENPEIPAEKFEVPADIKITEK